MTYRHVGNGRYEITRRLADAECGALKGMSRQAVNQTEERALYKLAMGLLREGVIGSRKDRERALARAATFRSQMVRRQELAIAREGARNER